MDDLDRRIVERLQSDARATNVALARELGVSEKTVRSRLAQMLATGTIRFEVTVAPDERQSRMLFLLHTQPGRRFDVAAALAARPEVDHVHLATGAYDVTVAASFPDDAHALEFFVREIEGNTDVRDAASCHLISEAGPSGTPVPAEESGPAIDAELIGDFLVRSHAFTSSADLLDAACEVAAKALSADRVMASVLAESSTAIAASRSRGLSDSYVKATHTRRAEGMMPVVTRVIDTGQHVLVPDARTDPLMAWAADLVADEGYVTFLTLPMLFGARVVGTLGLYFDQRTDLDDRYLATAQALADHLGMACARLGRS